MKIGIVASAGGSVIFELYPYLISRGIEVVVATDRVCGIEDLCQQHAVTYKRFAYENKHSFSASVVSFFKENQVGDLVFLYFLRFVAQELFLAYKTLNFHPSLLPLFPGLHPLTKQLQEKVCLVGATVHEVDDTCDGGPIRGQIANRYMPEQIEKISFLQKIFLGLAIIDVHFHKNRISKYFPNSNMGLTREAFAFFEDIQMRHDLRII
jgi:folate-dependent phosphoribosylglycinamide formyltransferase PurN